LLLVRSLVGDLVRLRLPDPGTGELEPRQLEVKRVPDRVDLPPRVETVGLRNLIGDRWALLRRHRCQRTEHSEEKSADQGNAARLRHRWPPYGGSEANDALE